MSYKDLYTMTSPFNTVPPQAVTDGTINGASVDRKFNESAIFLLHIGTWTDGDHTFTLEESDDDSNWSTISSDDLIGTSFALLEDGTRDDTVEHVGYKGFARYIRASVTTANSTTGAVFGISIVQDYPRYSGASQLTP